GAFREDLYYRLHVFAIHLPPLRERQEDILPLLEHFLNQLGPVVIGRPAAGVSPEAREQFLTYGWPGNVRELRNAVERALILCEGGLINPEHLPWHAEAARSAPPPPAPATARADVRAGVRGQRPPSRMSCDMAADATEETLGPLLDVLAQSLDVQEVFARISAVARQTVPHDCLLFGLVTEDGERYRVVAVSESEARAVLLEQSFAPPSPGLAQEDFAIFRNIRTIAAKSHVLVGTAS